MSDLSQQHRASLAAPSLFFHATPAKEVAYPLSAAFGEWLFSHHAILLNGYSIGFTSG